MPAPGDGKKSSCVKLRQSTLAVLIDTSGVVEILGVAGTCTISRITASGTFDAFSDFNASGEVSKAQLDDLIFAITISWFKPALSISRTSLLVSAVVPASD